MNTITLDECRFYATEANLDKALNNLGLDNYRDQDSKFGMRYIKCRNAGGRWTAVFLVSEFFHQNNKGGYMGIASQHGFASI